jgi:hypothetical protein
VLTEICRDIRDVGQSRSDDEQFIVRPIRSGTFDTDTIVSRSGNDVAIDDDELV